MPCPCRRHRGCSDCRHTELPLPLPWDWPHWTVQCRKDGTGAAGAFPDSPFRECPSLGAAGGLRHSARVCMCVCARGARCGHVCVQHHLCAPALTPAPLLPCALAWAGTSSRWHRAASASASVPVGCRIPGRCRIPGCPLGTPVSAHPQRVWLGALPSQLHPLLTLRVPGVRAGQGGMTQVLLWFSVMRNLNICLGAAPPHLWDRPCVPRGAVPAWPWCHCRRRDRRGCSGRRRRSVQ